LKIPTWRIEDYVRPHTTRGLCSHKYVSGAKCTRLASYKCTTHPVGWRCDRKAVLRCTEHARAWCRGKPGVLMPESLLAPSAEGRSA
jgi:hypothetical protein